MDMKAAKYVSAYFLKYYDDPQLQEQVINPAARRGLKWLLANNQSYDNAGNLVNNPWWCSYGVSSHPVFRHGQKMTLIVRGFEHGLIWYLRELQRYGEFEQWPRSDDTQFIKKIPKAESYTRIVQAATNPMTFWIISDLMNGKISGPPHDAVNLSQLHTLFGYSPGTGEEKTRCKLLLKYVPLGLVKVRYDGSRYAIEIGPVAETFYTEVYFKALEKLGLSV